MRNVEIEEPESREIDETTGIRYRKAGTFYSSRMVGSGSGECIGKDLIADATMELEMNSADEDSGDDDTTRLITTISPRTSVECINNNVNNNVVKCNNEIDSEYDENVWTISVQMFIPFLFAGFGMVAASLLLDVVQVIKKKKTLTQPLK